MINRRVFYNASPYIRTTLEDEHNKLVNTVSNNSSALSSFQDDVILVTNDMERKQDAASKAISNLNDKCNILKQQIDEQHNDIIKHKAYIVSLFEAIKEDIKPLSEHCPHVLEVVGNISINESGMLEEIRNESI